MEDVYFDFFADSINPKRKLFEDSPFEKGRIGSLQQLGNIFFPIQSRGILQKKKTSKNQLWLNKKNTFQ